MKVALAIDHLLHRDYATAHLEQLLILFPEADIFTLAHRRQAVNGPIEMTQIISTFLSNKYHSERELVEHPFQIFLGISNLKVPSNYDLLISVSKGIIPGLNWDKKNTKHIIYNLEDDLLLRVSQKKSLFHKVLSKRVRKHQSLSHKVFSPSKEIKPMFNSKEFSIDKSVPLSERKKLMIFSDYLSSQKLDVLLSVLEEEKVIGVIFGEEDPSLVKRYTSMEWVSQSCEGGLSRKLGECRGVVDLNLNDFPVYTLAAHSCGVPVLKIESELSSQILPTEGVWYIPEDWTRDSLKIQLQNFLEQGHLVESEPLRRNSLGYNGRVFKHQFQRELDQILNQ